MYYHELSKLSFSNLSLNEIKKQCKEAWIHKKTENIKNVIIDICMQ